jgi:hypothetical protein
MISLYTENKVPGYYIFRTTIKTKDGHKIFAKDFGKKAFRIFIKTTK